MKVQYTDQGQWELLHNYYWSIVLQNQVITAFKESSKLKKKLTKSIDIIDSLLILNEYYMRSGMTD